VSTGEENPQVFHSNTLSDSHPRANGRVPHISLVFREMWDTADLPLKPAAQRQISNQISVRNLKNRPQLLRRGAPCSHQRCPDFLLSSTSHDRACGFPSKKTAWSCSTPATPTGNPGYVGRKRWAKPTTAFCSELYRSFLRPDEA
jgi:hypothetical protein